MLKKTIETEVTKPTGLRAPVRLLNQLGQIAKSERRSVSNVVVYIVEQYLASTKGKLLKNVKVVGE